MGKKDVILMNIFKIFQILSISKCDHLKVLAVQNHRINFA